MTKQSGMQIKAPGLTACFLLGLVAATCPAQDFSADVVYLATTAGHPAHRSSKLYVAKDKMRLETRGLSDTILLVNGAEHAAIALFPARKAYQYLAGGPSTYFRVEDAENACPNWQRAADQNIVCEKVGHEAVDGRQTVKYSSKGASDAAASAVWIDTVLKFVVRWQSAGASAELRNIEEAELAADLFVVPPGYESLKAQKSKAKGFSQKSR